MRLKTHKWDKLKTQFQQLTLELFQAQMELCCDIPLIKFNFR